MFAVSAKSDISHFGGFFKTREIQTRGSFVRHATCFDRSHCRRASLKRDAVDLTCVPYLAHSGNECRVSLNDYRGDRQLFRSQGTDRLWRTAAHCSSCEKRVQSLPDAADLAESGFQRPRRRCLVRFCCRPRRRRETLATAHNTFRTRSQRRCVADRLKSQGMFVNLYCGAEFGKFLADQKDTYTKFTRV